MSLAILLGLLVIAVASFTYINILSVKHDVTHAYKSILKEQLHLRKVRNILLTINQNINITLLDPLNENLNREIKQHTLEAKNHLLTLNAPHHKFHHDFSNDIALTIQQFERLRTEIKKLVEYRLDTNKLYPALDINANIMERQQDSIKSGFEILTNEIESGSLNPQSPQLYPMLLKTYGIWINAISQTRIYAVNRLATFEVELLRQQGKSLNDIYELFRLNITQLRQLYDKEDSFEGPMTLESIENTAIEWHQLFLKIRQISESDHWRTDTMLIKTKIFPLVQEITQSIDKMFNRLDSEKN